MEKKYILKTHNTEVTISFKNSINQEVAQTEKDMINPVRSNTPASHKLLRFNSQHGSKNPCYHPPLLSPPDTHVVLLWVHILCRPFSCQLDSALRLQTFSEKCNRQCISQKRATILCHHMGIWFYSSCVSRQAISSLRILTASETPSS